MSCVVGQVHLRSTFTPGSGRALPCAGLPGPVRPHCQAHHCQAGSCPRHQSSFAPPAPGWLEWPWRGSRTPWRARTRTVPPPPAPDAPAVANLLYSNAETELRVFLTPRHKITSSHQRLWLDQVNGRKWFAAEAHSQRKWRREGDFDTGHHSTLHRCAKSDYMTASSAHRQPPRTLMASTMFRE